ncbi:MAG TPA: hypothetical protein VMH33_01285 [Solirubrobacterales bacterium]|nr:hypothetical protein [Solirubrobacterales bacterium]
MKYLVTATPGPLPPGPEQFDAALEWLDAKQADGTFDCLYGFLEGGGTSVVNADSHTALLEMMVEYPLYGMVVWDIRPLLAFREGTDTVRAKLVEAQAAMGAG